MPPQPASVADDHLGRVEQVTPVEPRLPSGDELTPTITPRRKPIVQAYAAQIAAFSAAAD